MKLLHFLEILGILFFAFALGYIFFCMHYFV